MSTTSRISKPFVFAHRGASGRCFENTMSAFKEALQQRAYGIELDVQLTADGIPFVLHDRDLRRVAGIGKKVSDFHSSELKDLKVGRKFFRFFFGHHIPTLMETVSFCAVNGLAMNIELKETVSEKPECLAEIIRIAKLLDDFHLSSFDAEILKRAKEIDPTIETALLVKKKSTNWGNLDDYSYIDGFHFHKRLYKEPFIGKLIASGKVLRMYGVSGNEQFVQEPDPNIDGWITDFPGKFN